MWTRFRLKELEQLHRQPSPRSFGITMAIVFTLIVVWKGNWTGLVWPVLLFVVAFAFPKVLAPFNRAWFALGLFLGWLMSPLFLTVFYFLVFTSMVLVLRLFGHKAFVKSGWVVKNRSCNFTRNF